MVKDIVTDTDLYESLYDKKYNDFPLRPSLGYCALEFTDACINSLNLYDLSNKLRAE